MNALLFLGGLVNLVLGASKFALSFGISPLVVGLTVVAMGTSAPERSRADEPLGGVIRRMTRRSESGQTP